MAQLPDSFLAHPARDASRTSMEAVERGDRTAWLALFRDDAVVEDPIGPSALDPQGAGHRGPEAIGAFYDTVIGPASVRFRIDESFAAGDECANVGCITTTLADGTVVETDGVFTYRVDAEGSIAALRAYWEMDRLRITPPQ